MQPQPKLPDDPEATVADFMFGEDAGAQPDRPRLSRDELHTRLSALIRSCEGCENVAVTATTRLDRPDAEGCNWSPSIVLDPKGTSPELYSLAYASVIAMARASWNLE